MLLFSDGFETYRVPDIHYKWSNFQWGGWGGNVASIVSGMDTSVSPAQPFATKDGRALYLPRTKAALYKAVAPSRSLFAGIAFRSRPPAVGPGFVSVDIRFLTNCRIEGGISGDYVCNVNSGGDATAADAVQVGKVVLQIYPYYTNVTWTLAYGPTTLIGRINTTMDMLSGDYHYIQAGMTISGTNSLQPQGWVEVRLGNRGTNLYRNENMLTTAPDGTGKGYLNGVTFIVNSESYGSPTIDDIYICNDDGTVNNSFLGNVKVRRVIPTGDGVYTDAVPVGGGGYRFQCVDEDFIDSRNALPYPVPSPESDPQFRLWEPGTTDYLDLTGKGRRQTLRFQSVGFSGSEPMIHGTVLHALAMAKFRGSGSSTVLKGIKRSGLLPIVEASPTPIPLTGERWNNNALYAPASFQTFKWQTYHMPFDNDEVVSPGQRPQVWSPGVVNAAEWGVELAECLLDPQLYDPGLTRFNIKVTEVVADFMGLTDYSHRYFEEPINESLVPVDSAPAYEYTWRLTDEIYLSPEIVVTKSFLRFINETLEFREEIPWTYLFAQDGIDFTDEIFLQWLDSVEDQLVADDWADGFWEELFTDEIGVEDSVAFAYIELLDEMFGLEEPYLWDGHETIEESLAINVTYIWDNHELMDEYLSPDDATVQGVGLRIEEALGMVEDHFDGWLVEQPEEWIGGADYVLTQHWRYETLFGMVINSWQVEPIEQSGSDGNHNGDNPWGA